MFSRLNARHAAGVLAVVLFAVIPGFARNSRLLSINSKVTVKGTEMDAGKYLLSWETKNPGTTVVFRRSGNLIVQAGATWVDRHKKYPDDAVVYTTLPDGSRILNEIRFAGMSHVLVFAALDSGREDATH